MAIELSGEQRGLAESIRDRWLEALGVFHSADPHRFRSLFGSVSADAHKLHRDLELGGQWIVHQASLVRNRGVQPSDPEFYQDIAAVEDLLKLVGCDADSAQVRAARGQR